MTNKQGSLVGALGSYFNELIAENLRPIVERINALESKALYQKGYSEAQTLRINELERKALYQKGYSKGQPLRIDELEKRLAKLEEKLDADFAWGRQAIHKIEELSELEKRVKMIDTRTANLGIEYDLLPEHAANLVFEKLGGSPTIYIESDQFRRRIFDIVDMALQHTTLSIKGSE